VCWPKQQDFAVNLFQSIEQFNLPAQHIHYGNV
jgi:hypothetical protein